MTTATAAPAAGPGPDGEAVQADPSTSGHVLAPDADQVPGGSLMPTLAGRYYTDPEIFAREQAAIFESMWFCAVRSSDLATSRPPGRSGPCRSAGRASWSSAGGTASSGRS